MFPVDGIIIPGFIRMIEKHLRFNLVYALVFILVLISGYKQWPAIVYIAKPCITLLLLIFLYLSTGLKGRFQKRLFAGLIFALAGDTLISIHALHSAGFIWGLIALIICHLFYIGAFYLDFRSAQELDKKGAKIAIISSAVAFSGFYFYLRPHVGPLKLPVLFCIFMMALLVMMAAFRRQRVNALSFKLVLTGVFFFVLTDAILADVWLNSTSSTFSLLMTAGFMIAQYLIVMGGAERKLVHTQTPD